MGLRKVPFKICYGEEKLADKLALFLETDQDGEVFYKIEGSCGSVNRFLVDYGRDREEMTKKFAGLTERLLSGQLAEVNRRM